MKTLYLTDLDGTLLRSDERLSDFTANTINTLVASGVNFSYATARSLVSASRVTAGLVTEFPVICYNGGFVFENKSKEILQAHYFASAEVEDLRRILSQHGISPIVYAFVDGVEHFSFINKARLRARFVPDQFTREEQNVTDGMRLFLDSRIGDPRRREVNCEDELYRGDMFYFIIIGTEPQLAPVSEIFKRDTRLHTIFHKDFYMDAWWCELLPAKATKGAAALELKAMLGCDRLVVFGDGINDIPLFSVADEGYAMANAVPQLKEIATAVIDSNDNDGVAKWLEKRLL